ncbi:30S ribosomal protein S20 [Candidatus Dojkabacteria bacterium]|nr:30S ribosomal protein S20 [Candidatus Dojkabacteria bacterium]
MANLKSAKKAIRKTQTRTLRNLRQKREMLSLIKEVRLLASKGEKKEAEEKFKLATKKIDKASKTHLLHKNTAARYKSRLAKDINKGKTKESTSTSKKAKKK